MPKNVVACNTQREIKIILLQGNYGNLARFFKRSHSGKITVLAKRITNCLNHFTSLWVNKT